MITYNSLNITVDFVLLWNTKDILKNAYRFKTTQGWVNVSTMQTSKYHFSWRNEASYQVFLFYNQISQDSQVFMKFQHGTSKLKCILLPLAPKNNDELSRKLPRQPLARETTATNSHHWLSQCYPSGCLKSLSICLMAYSLSALSSVMGVINLSAVGFIVTWVHVRMCECVSVSICNLYDHLQNQFILLTNGKHVECKPLFAAQIWNGLVNRAELACLFVCLHTKWIYYFPPTTPAQKPLSLVPLNGPEKALCSLRLSWRHPMVQWWEESTRIHAPVGESISSHQNRAPKQPNIIS